MLKLLVDVMEVLVIVLISVCEELLGMLIS